MINKRTPNRMDAGRIASAHEMPRPEHTLDTTPEIHDSSEKRDVELVLKLLVTECGKHTEMSAVTPVALSRPVSISLIKECLEKPIGSIMYFNETEIRDKLPQHVAYENKTTRSFIAKYSMYDSEYKPAFVASLTTFIQYYFHRNKAFDISNGNVTVVFPGLLLRTIGGLRAITLVYEGGELPRVSSESIDTTWAPGANVYAVINTVS